MRPPFPSTARRLPAQTANNILLLFSHLLFSVLLPSLYSVSKGLAAGTILSPVHRINICQKFAHRITDLQPDPLPFSLPLWNFQIYFTNFSTLCAPRHFPVSMAVYQKQLCFLR